MAASRPVAAISRRPIEGRSAARIAVISNAIRSPERWLTSVGLRADGGQRGGLDREVERGRQPHGANHPERVLIEPFRGVADRAQGPSRQVGLAAVRVDEPRRLARARRPRPSR